jgi:hypothetical protein
LTVLSFWALLYILIGFFHVFSIARYIVEGREREKYKGHGSDALIQIVWDTLSYGKSMKTNLLEVNHLINGPFAIAMLVYRRVCQ